MMNTWNQNNSDFNLTCLVFPACLINFHSTVADSSTFDVKDERPVKLGYLQNIHVLKPERKTPVEWRSWREK